ncbi:hypothetical protein HK101_002560 [Irineochytrium annulatum]|nr:hypothetical protein HK101_002560 [Irineochytrium annulatum]
MTSHERADMPAIKAATPPAAPAIIATPSSPSTMTRPLEAPHHRSKSFVNVASAQSATLSSLPSPELLALVQTLQARVDTLEIELYKLRHPVKKRGSLMTALLHILSLPLHSLLGYVKAVVVKLINNVIIFLWARRFRKFTMRRLVFIVSSLREWEASRDVVLEGDVFSRILSLAIYVTIFGLDTVLKLLT